MNHRCLFTVALLLVFAIGFSCFASDAYAAERKALKDVSSDAFTSETQRSVGAGANAFNLTWVIPVEFWEISLAQDKSLTPAQRNAILGVLKKYVIIGVVCADLSPFGSFKFYDEDRVFDKLKVAYVDARGKRFSLKTKMRAKDEAQLVIDSIKPIIRAALGNMGNNFHFFVCENNANGSPISPYEPGAMELTIGRIGNNPGGTAKVEYPLNCLYVPRKCRTCSKEAHISWKYCPWCGTKLGK